MAQSPQEWKCHPDLEVEWDNFTRECRRNTRPDDLNSELWVNFWRRGNVPTKTTSNLLTEEPLQQHEEFHEPDDVELSNTPSFVNEDSQSVLTGSQQQQIVGIVSELLDVLDMASDNIPEDLKDDIKLLPQHMVSLIFKELRERLTNQGIYSICRLFCEDSKLNSWVDIRLVFKEIFLAMICEESHNTLGEEIKAGLKLLTEHFPSHCVSHLLIPLLSNNIIAPKQLELLSDVIPALPRSDFSVLLRNFILQCKAPIEEWQILVLTCFLQTDKKDEVIIKTGSALLNLLPVLSLSARVLSANESFATLLLKMIPVLKGNSSVQVQNELMAIIQQSNSFNKQTMINALKN